MRHLPLILALALPFANAAAQGHTEARLGGVSILTHRNLLDPTGTGTATGSLRGAELVLRITGIGLRARLVRGDFAPVTGAQATGTLTLGDVGLLLGPRALALELGYGRRDTTDFFDGAGVQYGRVGLRSNIRLGSSGFTAVLAGEAMGRRTVTQSGTQTSYKVRVLEKRAETALLYRLPRPIPLYLTLGYQFAHVNQYDGKIEELSGIMLGAGFGVVP